MRHPHGKSRIPFDRYYSSRDLAKKLIDITYGELNPEDITEVIEPAAGVGAFSSQIPGCIAYDIHPLKPGIIEQDFLTLDLEYKPGRLIISNPPFGTRNTLAVQFFKKAIQLGDFIAFLLPISQLNNNRQMYEFDLGFSLNLGKQWYSGRFLECCWNIFTRPANGLNGRPHEFIPGVKIIEYRKPGKLEVPKEYDVAICSWGDVGREVKGEPGIYSKVMYIQFNFKKAAAKKRAKNLILKAPWRNLYKMTSAPQLAQWQVLKYLKDNYPGIENE